MFKYIKTIGAHSGAVEIERMPVNPDSIIAENSICEMEYGFLSNSYTDGKSKFITLESKDYEEIKTEIKCYRVLPGMLILADFEGDETNAEPGALVTVSANDDGCFTCCKEGNGNIEVVDNSEFAKTGKITVTFHC